MSEHPLQKAPHSIKPYLRLSYYDFQEWIQIINDDSLTKYESMRLKGMYETYLYGRTILQVPIIGAAFLASKLVFGPPINRRIGGRKEQMIFGTFFYVMFHHWADKRRVPSQYFDQIFSQPSPNGDELRRITKNNLTYFYEDIKSQLAAKGIQFPEPRPDD